MKKRNDIVRFCDTCSHGILIFDPVPAIECRLHYPVRFVMPDPAADLKTRPWGWQNAKVFFCPSHSMRARKRSRRRGGIAGRHARGLSGAPYRMPIGASLARTTTVSVGLRVIEAVLDDAMQKHKIAMPGVCTYDLATSHPGRIPTF